MASLEDPDLIGGRYRIVGALGSGNMGDVHRAVHAVTGQKVALKILRPHVAQGHGGVKRFLREVQAAATIDHPGVVTVFDAGTHGETLYIAMELLEGRSLGEAMAAGLPADAALAAMRQLLEPLAVAHEAGIIHRDLKPDNVFLAREPDGRETARLLDFGIAADQENAGATQTGLTIGTPYYMSPEQAVDPRTCTGAADVWSFGVMLYEIIAGEPPFSGVTAHGVILKAISQAHAPLPDTVPEALRTLIDACLSKDAADRPADARALMAAFDVAAPAVTRAALAASGPRASVSVPAITQPLSAAERPTRWPLWAAAAVLGGGTLTWALLSGLGGSTPSAAPDQGPAAAAVASAPDGARPAVDAAAPAAPVDARVAADAAIPDAAAIDEHIAARHAVSDAHAALAHFDHHAIFSPDDVLLRDAGVVIETSG